MAAVLVETDKPLVAVWPRIKPAIEAIRARYLDHCDWSVQDILDAVVAQRALLFISDLDGSFAIVKIKTRNDKKILFIWIACGSNGKREHNIDLLKDIARSAGTSIIEWESPRRGFDRLPGCKRGMTTYSMEV